MSRAVSTAAVGTICSSSAEPPAARRAALFRVARPERGLADATAAPNAALAPTPRPALSTFRAASSAIVAVGALVASTGGMRPAEDRCAAAGDASSILAGELEGGMATPLSQSRPGDAANFGAGGKVGATA